MHLGEPGNKKTKRIITGIAVGFILIFLITFWNEIKWFFGFPPAPEAAVDVLPPARFFFTNCLVGFFLIFILWASLISFQALLPISDLLKNPIPSLIEAYRASFYLVLHIFQLHGPAISVKDGLSNITVEDKKHEDYPGVIVIDFNSAVVLEERHPPPGLNGVFMRLLMWTLEALLLVDASESPRVCAPGIVFTRPRERIRGVVDLRRQFRLEPKVHCYTREGIELYANILSLFTIGEDPDVLQVTYDGEARPENLRVVTLSPRSSGFQRVTGFLDDLDETDRIEIHEFFMRAGKPEEPDKPVFLTYNQVPDTRRQVFNRERVFSAVFAQAKNARQEVLPWHELPIRVAASLYRELLLQINYDDLYDIKSSSNFPLPEYKSKLRLAMRNNGILSYRLLQHTSGAPLIRGRIYSEKDLVVTEPRALTNSKLLRDRGIKVIFSGFGDLIPVNEQVYKQRLENWRIPWEEELGLARANQDLQAMRVSSRAHSQAQQDLWLSLKQLFEQTDFTEEALALRILQALDQAAEDPKTRALLPTNTLDMMRNLQNLLMPAGALPPNMGLFPPQPLGASTSPPPGQPASPPDATSTTRPEGSTPPASQSSSGV